LSGLNVEGIDWVIVGGESGRTPRPIKEEWVLEIQKSCQAAKVPFFFKQWGGRNKKKAGSSLNGRQYKETPMKKAA
jgi:protein gp37